MSKQDIVFALNIKYQIVQEHEDSDKEIPSLLALEINELEKRLTQVMS